MKAKKTNKNGLKLLSVFAVLLMLTTGLVGVLSISDADGDDDYIFTLYFDGNGGTPKEDKKQTIIGGITPQPVTFTLTTATHSDTWTYFVGWTTVRDDPTTFVGRAGDTHVFTVSEVLEGSRTFYAYWKYSDSPIVIYKAGVGTIDRDVVEYGPWIYLPDATTSSHKRVLEGWYNGSTRVGGAYDSIQISKDTILTAKYKTLSGYEVTFDGNGGSAYEDYLIGTSIELPYASRGAHDFMGWSTTPDGSDYVGTSGDTYKPTKDITLYAIWERRTSGITASFNVKGEGTVNNESSAKIDAIPNNAYVTVNGNRVTIDGRSVYAVAAEGYEFFGWQNVENGERINEDKTITALFVLKEGYSVFLKTQKGGLILPDEYEGKITGVPYNSDIVVDNDKLVVNGIVFTAVATTGFTFKGWTVSTQKITENMTIYAKFESNQPTPPGPTPPEPDEPESTPAYYLYIAVGTGTGAIVLIGVALTIFKHPAVYILAGILTIVAVAAALLYTGVIKL